VDRDAGDNHISSGLAHASAWHCDAAETERKILEVFSRGNVWYTTAMVAIVLGGWLAYAGFTA